jgi:hypothetical protein
MPETTEQMTETDAMALCLASPLMDGRFGKEQAERAANYLAQLFQQGRISAETFARITARIGNHSAVRQWSEKTGLIHRALEDDALSKAVRAFQSKLAQATAKATK